VDRSLSAFLLIISTILFTFSIAPLVVGMCMRTEAERCYQRDTGSFLLGTPFLAECRPWPCPHFARSRRLVEPRDINARCDSVVRHSRPMLSRLFSRNDINMLYVTLHNVMFWLWWHEKKATRYLVHLFFISHFPPPPLLHLLSAYRYFLVASVGDDHSDDSHAWFTFTGKG
jgi:hypothetical protein